ncbi:cellulose binding domain-containing protein [Lentzea rhizosphaerae]|uniref:Cellulose binding domain-containing protein n=1 Tax=Lentzea rhizosphaerae TaxID=2041025 RepID=A0ABV8BZX1_9PSEU
MREGWRTVAVAMVLVSASCAGNTTTPTGTITPSRTPSIVAPPSLQDTVRLTVHGVIDGRTVLLSDGSRIVIDGLAAPEPCWAAAAAVFAKSFLLDRPVLVERFPSDEEAALWLQDGTEYALLTVGQGVLRGDAPHDPAYGAAEDTAKRAGLGLWGPPCLGQATPPSGSATPAPTYGCTVTYRVAHRWQNGFHAEVTIANTGNTLVTDWSLRWTFARGERVTDTWNTKIEQSGATVKAGASATIPAGGTQWLRFNATQGPESPVPQSFTLNDRRCDVRSA